MKQYALISVRDRRGLASFVRELIRLGFEIVSTRGTALFLRGHGVPVIDVEKVTGYPPLVGKQGIKVLHPAIFSGILADTKDPSHVADLEKYGIHPFSIVVCNFYQFDKIIARKKFTHEEAVFEIDIGGPAMVRCAAKNYNNTTILTDPGDYKIVIKEFKKNGGTSDVTRKRLSLKAFKYAAGHDKVIIKYLSGVFGKP